MRTRGRAAPVDENGLTAWQRTVLRRRGVTVPFLRFKTIAERLEHYSIPEPMSGCVLWIGAVQGAGYGTMANGAGGSTLAHRAAYEYFVGPIPVDFTLDHLCRNRACVNPKHLEPVTFRENVLRGFGVGAIHARQTSCIRGHAFTLENTIVRPTGARACRICKKASR